MDKSIAAENTESLLPPPSGGGTHSPSVLPVEEITAAGSGVVSKPAQTPDAGLAGPDLEEAPAKESSLADEIDVVVRQALAEDIGTGDLTTEAAIASDVTCTADLVVKESGVLCGLPVAQATFAALDSDLRFEVVAADGMQLAAPRTSVAAITGSATALLTGERTALNLIGRLSGIASLTRQFVDAIDGTGAVILDTRKTTPRLRALEKYAVRCGGGQNHRFGLFDAVLVKENHIRLAGGLAVAVERVRRRTPDAWIEVEVEDLAELDQALDLEVDRIMLDNMPPELMVEAAGRTGGTVELEASGGITLENVRAVAKTGVDFISVGALTRSAASLDVSLEIR